jgi:D-xylose transport system substrate-binding protein
MSTRIGGARIAAAAAMAAVLALFVAACGTSSDSSTSATSGGSESGTVGLLLPESKTTRYEAFDHPYFEQDLKDKCPDCTLEYANADQDAAQQQSQAESMLTKGVDVLVLDPVDGKAAEAIVNKAKAQDVPVISYDRLASGPVDYYVSFDNEKVGELQGQALLDALDEAGTTDSGDIVMINGAPTDPNAAQFKKGAESVLNGQVTVGKEFDTPDWSPDKAQSEMQSAITSIGKDQIVGVYSANDGMATGISAAMKSAGMTPPPPLTGQDAELDAIQRLLTGDQTMTVYKAIGPEAEAAAGMAVALIQGDDYTDATDSVNNGTADVPSQLLDPVVVTVDNIADTVVKDGFYKVSQICTPQYAAACKKAGLE